MKMKACVALTLCLISKLKLKTPLTVFNVCIILLERANSSQQWSNNPSLEGFTENVGDLPPQNNLKTKWCHHTCTNLPKWQNAIIHFK